jgi:CRP-like cAMP-binding protein
MVISKNAQLAPIWELDSIWSSLTADERILISEQMEVVRYEKNEVIHLDGESSQYIWVLVSGKVRIYKEGIGQRQQIIRLLKPFDLFGYRAVIANEPYNTNASALEQCVVYRLSNQIFNQLIRANGTFCYMVMRTMAMDLAFSELQMVNLTQKHIRGRLAESLLHLRKHYGYLEDGRTLAMTLPREDLANMSNMTTSNAIRTLSQFAQEGLILLERKLIQILDEIELERISRMG